MIAIALSLALAAPPAAAPPPEAPAAAVSCNDTTQFTRRRVEGLLNLSRTQSFPGTRINELAPVSFGDLRLLRDAADAAVCQQIRTSLLANRLPDAVTGRPWLVTIYSGRGYYFAVISRDQGPVVRQTGPVTLAMGGYGGLVVVLDSNLNRVVTVNT